MSVIQSVKEKLTSFQIIIIGVLGTILIATYSRLGDDPSRIKEED